MKRQIYRVRLAAVAAGSQNVAKADVVLHKRCYAHPAVANENVSCAPMTR